MAESFKEEASSIFRKNYANLTTGIQNDLPVLVPELYSSLLVTASVRNKVLDTSNSTDSQVKCIDLINCVEERISRNHSDFETFCNVLCKVGLEHLGEPMRSDFQQLCNSTKQTFHGNYTAPPDSTSEFPEPTSESHVDVAIHDTPEAQTERLVKYDLGSSVNNSSTFVKTFDASQPPVGDCGEGTYGELIAEQVVSVEESSSPGRTKIGSLNLDYSAGRFSTQRSFQEQDFEEKCLIGDVKVTFDRIAHRCASVQVCGNCESIQAEYESKLEGLREFYDKQLKDSTAESASSQQKLVEDKHCLVRALDIQMEEKQKKEEEIEQLKSQARKQEDCMRKKENELEFAILLKEREMKQLKLQVRELQTNSKKEQDKLKSAISSKEKELHDLNQMASHCPFYGNKIRQANFQRKKDLCSEVQSLVKQFSMSQSPNERRKLHGRIQRKLTHITPPLERCRSFSL